eukprot:g11415.t1
MWGNDLNDADRKHYKQLAEQLHEQAVAEYGRAIAVANAKDEANKAARLGASIRQDFYNALEDFVRGRWPSISVEKAHEARTNFCERRVPTLLPGKCQVVGDSSTGLRKRLGQIVKGLNPEGAAQAGTDSMQHVEGEFLPDGDLHVVHEPPQKPLLLKSLARVLLVEYREGALGAGGGIFGEPAPPDTAVLVLSASLSPLNFWGIELEPKLGGGWKIPEHLQQVRTVSGNMLCNIVGESIYLAAIDGKSVVPIGGELVVQGAASSANPKAGAAASTSIGHGMAGSLSFESTREWEACLMEHDETKTRERLDKLMDVMESHEPAAKRRRDEIALAEPEVRPGLEIVRDVVASGSSSADCGAKSRVKVADRASVLVLSDQERSDLVEERTRERQAAAVASYRIKSGDSKFTETMTEKGAKKKDTKKRVVEPTSKADIRKYCAAKWLFKVLGSKSLEFSITSAACADDVRHVLNAWACRHAFVLSCIRGETVQDLQAREPDAGRGVQVGQQWEMVLDAWKAQNDRTPTDKTLHKKLQEIEALPDGVKNMLSPLSSEEDGVAAPVNVINDAPEGAPPVPPPAGGNHLESDADFVEDQEDDLLA